jgi:hypothetical protein
MVEILRVVAISAMIPQRRFESLKFISVFYCYVVEDVKQMTS